MLAYVAAFLLALAMPAQPAEPDLSGGAAAFNARASDTLEVKRLKTGQLIVKPTINGHAAGWFIFDTGAGICVVSKPKTKELELESSGDIKASGIGGSRTLALYRARTLTLGPLTLTDHPIMEADLAFLTPLVGEEISGVIGYGVLSQCIVEIDLATPRIAIHDPRDYKLPRGEWTDLVMKERIPCVRATCEDHEGLFRLDTGADSFVTFHEPTVKKWNMLEGRDVSSAKLGGVGGFVKAKRGTVKTFELGGVRRENMTATFAIEPKGNFAQPDIDGNIGSELLKSFTLFIDYAGSRIGLIKRDE